MRTGRRALAGRPDLVRIPALLIIDVQYRTTGTVPRPFWELIKEFPTSCGDVAWQAIDKIQTLLTLFRERNWPVLYPYVSPKTSFDSGRLSDKVPAIMNIEAKGYEFVDRGRAASERCPAAEEAPERIFWNAAGELPDQPASRHPYRDGMHHERLRPRIGRRRLCI